MSKALRVALLFFLSLGGIQSKAQFPIHIEAENVAKSSRTDSIPCVEGNKCLRMDLNGWADYNVTISTAGIYKVSMRVAGTPTNVWVYDTLWNCLGKLHFIDGTASDQSYTTISGSIYLKASVGKIRLQPRGSTFDTRHAALNVNWLEIAQTNLLVSNDFESDWEPYYYTFFPWQSDKADSLSSTWQTGTGFYGWIKQTARPESMVLHNNKSGMDVSALKFELAKSDSSTWPNVRAEIYKTACPSQQMWFGFNFMSPTDVTGDGLAHTLFQMHGQGGGLSPCISIRVENGRYNMKVLWSSVFNPTTHQGEVTYDLGEYETGVWVKWVMYVKFAWDNTGMLQLWKDGIEVATRLNLPNCYNESSWPYPKFGIYKWGWTPQWASYSPYNVLTHYYDSLRIGGSSSSYSEVTH